MDASPGSGSIVDDPRAGQVHLIATARTRPFSLETARHLVETSAPPL